MTSGLLPACFSEIIRQKKCTGHLKAVSPFLNKTETTMGMAKAKDRIGDDIVQTSKLFNTRFAS